MQLFSFVGFSSMFVY